jgi:hypothetical protein
MQMTRPPVAAGGHILCDGQGYRYVLAEWS